MSSENVGIIAIYWTLSREIKLYCYSIISALHQQSECTLTNGLA